MEDADGDGIPDHLDNDDGGDGIPDGQEEAVAAAIKAGTMKDTDGDGIPDHMLGPAERGKQLGIHL